MTDAPPAKTIEADVCVYGGTPGGVMMAIQAKRMGKSAMLVVFRNVAGDYLHDNNEEQGKKSITFTPKLPKAGRYDVYLIWSANGNRASNVPVENVHAGGNVKVTVNQKKAGGWNKIFTGEFAAGMGGSVTIRTDGADGFVIADAVRFVAGEMRSN